MTKLMNLESHTNCLEMIIEWFRSLKETLNNTKFDNPDMSKVTIIANRYRRTDRH